MGANIQAVTELVRLMGFDDQSNRYDVDWSQMGRDLGVKFPADYRELLAIVPALDIQSWVRVWHPFEEPRGSWRQRVTGWPTTLEMFRELRPELPFSADREPGGLLPWGDVNDDYVLCWHMNGPVDQWPVVVVDYSLTEWELFQGSMSEFLLDLLSGNISSQILRFLNEEMAACPVEVSQE